MTLAGLAVSSSGVSAAPRRTVEQRLADLASALHCDAKAPDDPERHVGCLVAQHWGEAKADPLPTSDTPLVGGTIEFPDTRPADWKPKTLPAVGGMRMDEKRGRICENDMIADSTTDRAAITAIEAPLREAFASLTAPLLVSPTVAKWAKERVADAPSPLTKRGDSWTTRFMGAVELRHLGKRWFLIETRRGDSGLWISAFTADFTIGATR